GAGIGAWRTPREGSCRAAPAPVGWTSADLADLNAGARPMAEEPSFQTLILRIRAGDEAAAAEVVRRYEPAIRRAVRVRLRDPRRMLLIESVDVCQSGFGSILVQPALRRQQLSRPCPLLRLHASIVR